MCLFIYGLVMFFFVTIPLLAEGDAILTLTNISDSKVDEVCNMSFE